MRSFVLSATVAMAALGFFAASPAAAEPVSIAPVTIAPELATQFEEEYGERETAIVQDMITHYVSAELERRGAQVGEGAPLVVDITLLEAEPNKPTMAELSRTPGLDYFSSISLGGASIKGVIRRADGTVLSEIEHSYFTPSLDEINYAGGPWAELRRTARRFATKVGQAYSEQVGASN